MRETKQSAIIQAVSDIANEKVDTQDYERQVDRWNRFQLALDKIEHQSKIENFRFQRGLHTSYHERRNKNLQIYLGFVILSMACFTVYDAFTVDIHSLFLDFDDNVTKYAMAHVVWDMALPGIIAVMFAPALAVGILDFGKLPDNIKFECKPELFIDDRFYVQKFIRGMERETKDPEVKLPTLTMELPHTWIKQMSLLKGMETFQNHKLD